MFESILSGTLTITNALICTAVSVVLGLIIAFVYMAQGGYTKSLAITICLLPIITQVVIMMVNGNLGTGVAIMGAFSLVRFRSVPGSSKEIVSIFFAMSVGLATGMGYLTFAVLITVIIAAFMLILSKTPFGEAPKKVRQLRITIPEDLDYTTVFDDIFSKYTKNVYMERVKTTNLGSMFELTYSITLKDIKKEKEFIDEIRCRNGNLTILMSKAPTIKEEL